MGEKQKIRTGREIYECISRKAAETVKNEVIALTDQDLDWLVHAYCPHDLGLFDWCGTDKCVNASKICTGCWEEASGRRSNG